MILVGKPHKQGTPQELDGSDNSTGLQNLASDPGADLLNAIDHGPHANPDGAQGAMGQYGDFMSGAPDGNPQAGRNASGMGNLHPTVRTSAPMRNPFPAPGAPQTRTRPMSATK